MSMRQRYFWVVMVALVLAVAGGCARAARDTTGFAITDTATLNTNLDDAWQATKAVLRERELDIYTRDKRGVFVAYSEMKRRALLVPHRTKYTIVLESLTDETTRVEIETVKQVYGVTLLTHPNWHDRQTTDNSVALTILEDLKARTGG